MSRPPLKKIARPMGILCPFCAERIATAAKKCKHCGEFLDGRTAPARKGSGSAGRIILGVVFGFALLITLVLISGNSGTEDNKDRTGVESWMRMNLNDSSSAEIVGFSPRKSEAGRSDRMSRLVRIRAKNGFGAYIVKDYFFLFDEGGRVIEALEVTN